MRFTKKTDVFIVVFYKKKLIIYSGFTEIYGKNHVFTVYLRGKSCIYSGFIVLYTVVFMKKTHVFSFILTVELPMVF
jgi:hypothetical protein